MIFSKFGNKAQDAQKQAQALRANFSHTQGKPSPWTENLGKVTDFLCWKKLILSIMLGQNSNFEHNTQSTQY